MIHNHSVISSFKIVYYQWSPAKSILARLIVLSFETVNEIANYTRAYRIRVINKNQIQAY